MAQSTGTNQITHTKMRKSLERNLYNGSETWREDSLINDNSKYLKSFGKRNKFQFQFFFAKGKKSAIMQMGYAYETPFLHCFG